MNYQEALDFLYGQLPMYQRVGAKAFKKDLTNTIDLVSYLNNPHRQFESVHIAGTNGKGSTAHMIASVLQESGYKVGLYTSPHLRSFRERIRVNGEMVQEQFIPEFVQKLKSKIHEIQPSFFELTVAMAFDYFAITKVDIAVIETGLGGRLDSTNVIVPKVSVITSISLDHQDMLGDSIKLIAKEKGGIIKEKVPIVIGKLPEEAVEVIEGMSKEKNAELMRVDQINLSGIESSLTGTSLNANIDTVYQSIQALNSQGYNVSDTQFRKGIKNVVKNTGLKGRWQVLNNAPCVICDVGHNEEAIAQLVKQMNDVKYDHLHIVLGMVNDKSIDSVLSLLQKDANYYFCAAKVPRAMNVNDLQQKALAHGLKGDTYHSVSAAYQMAINQATDHDLVFIGGSTFVVAEIEDL